MSITNDDMKNLTMNINIIAMRGKRAYIYKSFSDLEELLGDEIMFRLFVNKYIAFLFSVTLKMKKMYLNI